MIAELEEKNKRLTGTMNANMYDQAQNYKQLVMNKINPSASKNAQVPSRLASPKPMHSFTASKSMHSDPLNLGQ